jgi:hypothetical protein
VTAALFQGAIVAELTHEALGKPYKNVYKYCRYEQQLIEGGFS